MTTSRLRGGSRVSARDQAPSVNLARLAELLSQSINVTTLLPPGTYHSYPRKMPSYV